MNFEPLTFVLERVADLLIDGIKFLSTDTKTPLRSLQQELQLAQSFVRDVEEAKQKATISHVLETEVQHIMEILPDIEDFLDTFYQKEEEAQQIQKRSRLQDFVPSISRPLSSLVRKRYATDNARELTERLQDTRKRAEPYKLPRFLPQETKRRRPPTQPYIINDEFIVGLEEDVRSLVAKIVGKEGDPTTTMAIVGMGGSGKTTLARNLYKQNEIVKHFSKRAWVCVSQEWDTPQLLRQICVQVGIQLAEAEMSFAGFKLHEFLQSTTCFVVLDDVWKREALQELLPFLLSGPPTGGSRVLITTRNEKIVTFHNLGHFHIHKARRLTPKESWDLFSNIVHKNWQGNGNFEDEGSFAQLGKEMLEKCKGLPLAIVALAGLLSTKATIQDWESTKNDVISRIIRHDNGSHDYGAVKEMLELSYSDLPYDLKPCFLYLGIFREDRRISVADLKDLWVAEGFVRANICKGSEALDDVAGDFFDELVQRCMVEVAEQDYDGKVAAFQLHDLMRDFCIEKAKDLSFFEISSPSTPSTSVEPKCRRVIIIHKGESLPAYSPRLRSCIYYSGQIGKIRLELPYEKMKLLRVLVLQYVNLGDSAQQIGNLICLRHLEMLHCSLAKPLPESIKKLRNLLAFKYIVDDEESLPNNTVGGMEHLRHLIFDSVGRRGRVGPGVVWWDQERLIFGPVGRRGPVDLPVLWVEQRHLIFGPEGRGGRVGPTVLGVDKPKNLKSLTGLAGEWVTKELRAVSMGLESLDLYYIDSQAQLDAVHDFVSNPSNHLQTLELRLKWGLGLEYDLQKSKLENCRRLKSLCLQGKIRNQQPYLSFPPNLLTLELIQTEIEEEEDMEKALAQLGQLRLLMLASESYVADKLTVARLPQLQKLDLSGTPNLKELNIEKGALPQLKMLSFYNCDQLERISEGIADIHTLDSFVALCMPESFCKRFQRPSLFGGGGGEDFHLIRHIPLITVRSDHWKRYA